MAEPSVDNARRPVDAATSDDKYRLLVEAVTDYALYMLDAHGHVTSWNPGAERFKGYTAAQVLGTHFSAFYVPDDRAADLPGRALVTAIVQGRFEGEGWRLKKDGSTFWAHVVIDPIWDEQHGLIGFAKITRDQSARKAAAEALRQSEEQFRRLVQGVTDYAIYMLDLDGGITTWNAGAQRINGYAKDEIVGQHFSRIYRQEDRDRGLPAHALAMATKHGRFESEGWRIRKEGTSFWASVVVEAIQDDDGRVIGFAKITRDVTSKREAAQALMASQASLFQSQKLEAVGRLTGGVAHDFNNLLTVVLTSLELMKRISPDDPKHARLRDNAAQAARRGAALTQRMLSFARQQSLTPSRVEVIDLVLGVHDMLSHLAGPTVDLQVERGVRLRPVLVDANQMELALLNLVTNARDSMPAGGSIVITASDTELPPDRASLGAGPFVRLSVADNGAGMDTDTLARAAEPFFTTKGVGEGTGLGLSMAHGLAHQSGGYLDIDSEPGQGTTVTFWFPAAPEVQAGSFEQRVGSNPAPAVAARPTRVLVVDDDSLVLAGTVAMVEALGHSAVAASSGDEALAIASCDEKIEVLLTDQVMPGITGLQLIDRLATLRPSLVTILVSGYTHSTLPVPSTVFRLNKPFELDGLASALASVRASVL